MSSSFGLYSQYYDLLYQDKDYLGETQYVWQLLRDFSRKPLTSLLELGSGTGVHANLLAERGVDVTGVELSREMLQMARLRSDSQVTGSGVVSLVEGDARAYRAGRTFDAVISLFHVLSYQVTDADLKAMLDTASAHLECDGVFIFDFWYGPAVLWQQPTARIKRWSDEKISVTRIAEPTVHDHENVVDVKYTIFAQEKESGAIEQIEELHRMRYLFLSELDSALSAAGFERLQAEEWLTRVEPSTKTWGVCVVARKR